ncbi:MAG TPA: MmcQ/YjbR family DNA-binding protein [Nocardioidaceae bacterium]|nr:MmcQ/YjbR family DNA-binding protein [Nocardioidaceae bacterium]
MPQQPDVPLEIVERLRAACRVLPEAYEEEAWVGVRWRIRKRTIAHLRPVRRDQPGHEAAYALSPDADGPLSVMTFRSPSPEYEVLINAGRPFYRLDWGDDVVGMLLDGDTDWDEVAELLIESYCLLAPKSLAALVDRPSG